MACLAPEQTKSVNSFKAEVLCLMMLYSQRGEYPPFRLMSYVGLTRKAHLVACLAW